MLADKLRQAPELIVGLLRKIKDIDNTIIANRNVKEFIETKSRWHSFDQLMLEESN